MNHEEGDSASRRRSLARFSESVSLLVALFVISLVALAGWIAYFVFDATFFGRPDALGGLWLTAALSGGVGCSAGFWCCITGVRTTPKAKRSSTAFSWWSVRASCCEAACGPY